jgi:hypothetical protein
MSFMASHIQNTDLHHETIVFQEKKPATQMSEKNVIEQNLKLKLMRMILRQHLTILVNVFQTRKKIIVEKVRKQQKPEHVLYHLSTAKLSKILHKEYIYLLAAGNSIYAI